MKVALLNWWQDDSGGGPTPGAPYDLLRFKVNYRTTDFSWLTSAPFTDTAGPFRSGSNPVQVETAAIDGPGLTNAIVGAGFIYSDTNPLIVCIETITNDVIFYNPVTLVEVGRTSTTNYSQGLGIDPVNEWFYSLNSTGQIQVTDFTGAVLSTLTCPAYTPSNISAFYDYVNDEIYVFPHTVATGTLPIAIWERTAPTVFSLKESTWYFSGDGGAIDNVIGKFINFHGAGANNTCRIREQTIDGKTGINVWNVPIGTGWTTEGLTCLPDGCFLASDPSALHGGIVGGNRFWVLDPRAVRGKYDRSPSMTRLSRFTGGTVSGAFDTQKITQNANLKIYSPVYDTDGFTNTENTSAWTFEFSEGGDADISFVGSNTAPTLTPDTSLYSDLPNYAGWGATVPSAEQATPGTFRYKQAVLLVKDATPSTEITIQDILDEFGSDLKVFTTSWDPETSYVLTDPITGTARQCSVVVNQADETNNLNNATETQRREHNLANRELRCTGANSHHLLGSTTPIASDQTFHIVSFSRREIATTRAFYFTIAVSSTNTNRIEFGQMASGGTPANHLYLAHWGATATAGAFVVGSGYIIVTAGDTNFTLIGAANSNVGTFFVATGVGAGTGTATAYNRVSVLLNDLVYHKVEAICDGVSYSLKVDGVTQALTVFGLNTGAGPADLTGINRTATGFLYGTTSVAGKHRERLLLYSSTVNDAARDTIIADYGTQENLLA